MTDTKQINEIVKLIVRYSNPDKIYLFGSYADGTATEKSDLDLIVIKDTDLPHHNRTYEIKKYFKGVLIPVDIMVYSQKEMDDLINDKYSFIYNALKSGIILYDKSGENKHMA